MTEEEMQDGFVKWLNSGEMKLMSDRNRQDLIDYHRGLLLEIFDLRHELESHLNNKNK